MKQISTQLKPLKYQLKPCVLYLLLLLSLVEHSLPCVFLCNIISLQGMNAAVRAVVRMGLYVGAKVYFIHEVSSYIQYI